MQCTRTRDKQRRICITICNEVYNRYKDNQPRRYFGLHLGSRFAFNVHNYLHVLSKPCHSSSFAKHLQEGAAGVSVLFLSWSWRWSGFVITDNFPVFYRLRSAYTRNRSNLSAAIFKGAIRKREKKKKEKKRGWGGGKKKNNNQKQHVMCYVCASVCVRACTCVLDEKASRVFASRVLVVV